MTRNLKFESTFAEHGRRTWRLDYRGNFYWEVFEQHISSLRGGVRLPMAASTRSLTGRGPCGLPALAVCREHWASAFRVVGGNEFARFAPNRA